jgi:hypothetical protein
MTWRSLVAVREAAVIEIRGRKKAAARSSAAANTVLRLA